jgi:hypothetical protein
MSVHQSNLGKALIWGVLTAGLYGFLFKYADIFKELAHTTIDACVIQETAGNAYYSKSTPERCAAENGTYVKGTWWFVFAPIALALALSYTHGIFTGLFWDVVGLRAKK